jgi:hypothetical protein
MKIHGITDIPAGLQPGKAVPSAPAAPGGFRGILQTAIHSAAAEGTAAAPVAPVALRPAVAAADDAAVAQLEGFLDILEDYRRQLADPRVSLKGLEASVRQVEQGREEAASLLRRIPDGGGLKDILNRALVTASLEIVRFQRGDYLPE